MQYSNWAKCAAGGEYRRPGELRLRRQREREYGRLGGQRPGSSSNDNQISTDGNYNYYYDPNGNLTKQVQCAGNTQTDEPHEIDYTYDFRNRLTSVTDKDSSGRVTQVVNYVYDAFNNLVGRTQTNYTYTGGSTTPASTTSVTGHFVFDGSNMVLVLDNSGAVTERVLWGPAVDQVLAEENSSGVVTWALSDNQNTVRDLATFNGSSDLHRRPLVYTAFGQPLSTLPADFQFGYTGRYFDTATGLQWNLNRWYNPNMQRWMRQDPSGLGPDANPYRYCGNAADGRNGPEWAAASRTATTSQRRQALPAFWSDNQTRPRNRFKVSGGRRAEEVGRRLQFRGRGLSRRKEPISTDGLSSASRGEDTRHHY